MALSFSENSICVCRVCLLLLYKDLDLRYIHSEKILHRDLKTSNIFLTEGAFRIRNLNASNCSSCSFMMFHDASWVCCFLLTLQMARSNWGTLVSPESSKELQRQVLQCEPLLRRKIDVPFSTGSSHDCGHVKTWVHICCDVKELIHSAETQGVMSPWDSSTS